LRLDADRQRVADIRSGAGGEPKLKVVDAAREQPETMFEMVRPGLTAR
jgi:hypothetical protein